MESAPVTYSNLITRPAFLPEDIPNGFKSTITAVAGHQMHAVVSEKAFNQAPSKIILIHGATASRRYLMPTAELLAQHLHVFVPELIGHGASSRPHHALTVEEHADVLYHWIQETGIASADKPHIFTNSYGCQVTAKLVSKYPDIVDHLILSGPTTDPRAANVWQQALRLYQDGDYEPHGAESQFFADISDMGIPIAWQTVQEMVHNDIRTVLGQIKCKTLVLRGEHDTLAPEDWTREVADSIPGAVFGEIAGAPHCVNYATAADLTRIILEFIVT